MNLNRNHKNKRPNTHRKRIEVQKIALNRWKKLLIKLKQIPQKGKANYFVRRDMVMMI